MKTKFSGDSLVVDSFVQKLIEEKGLDNLEAEVLQQVKSDLSERVEERINAVVIEKMPAEKLEFFEKMIEKSNPEETQAFVKRNIPDLDVALASELAEFRKKYLNL